MLTYSDCKEEVKRARNKEKGKKIDHNTYLRKEGEIFFIKLHNTDIVMIDPGNIYTHFHGGWITVTTKDRILKFSPISFYQKSHVWYIGRYPHKKDNPVFFEGIQCNSEGEVLNLPEKKETEKESKKRKALDKMIKEYIQGYILWIKETGLKDPLKGDCMGCLFVDASKGIVKGGLHENESMGFDHYISHFEESYFVPSLLWKAINERGYSNPSFIWQWGDVDIFKQTLQWFFNKRKAELLKYI